MNILGISAFYHDSAAALVIDGEIVAAAQEERFTRIKHDAAFPSRAVEFCLSKAKLSISDIDYVVFYEKPFVKFERLLQTYMEYAPRGVISFIKAISVWIKKKLWIKDLIRGELQYEGEILFTEHHESHSASAFFASPYQDAAVLTMDGVGEWATASIATGKGNKLELTHELSFPHSLGLLYSAFTQYAGFKVNSGEYKLMGLAPYGKPTYKKMIFDHLIDLKDDGSFRLNMKYFNYPAGLTMINKKFENLFGGPARKSESEITQKDMDIARSIQEVIEELVLNMTRFVHRITKQDNLCLAGGVALNCVSNGRLKREGPFKNIWIQPAAGDAGGALGAALFVWFDYLNNPRETNGEGDSLKGSYLGPEYTSDEIESFLKSNQIPHTKLEKKEIGKAIANLIADEKVIGLFQGAMEFGPRALGARSIIGDPRSTKMQSLMNLKIKYRESFRPFAPAVLLEKVSDYFDCNYESPYMLMVEPVNSKIQTQMTDEEENLFGIKKLNVVRSTLPAITHVDYSARIQTVTQKRNGLFYDIVKQFDEQHGCPVVINTSFNVRGEPIVCTPEDAYRCFMRTEMDYLVLENFILAKELQPKLTKDSDWQSEYELD
jgi:carbamoyltransferase